MTNEETAISIRLVTRLEAIERPKSTEKRGEIDPLADLNFEFPETAGGDEIVGIVASDGEQVVGKIAIGRSAILTPNGTLPLITTKDLFVHPEYRDKAVGARLIFTVLSLGKSYIFGGVATKLDRVLMSWKRYKPIDRSPTYYFPHSAIGKVKTFGVYWRNRLDKNAKHPVPGLVHIWRAAFSSRREAKQAKALYRLSTEEALKAVPELISKSAKMYQVPHNPEILKQGLRGEQDNLSVAVFEHSGTGALHIVNTYWNTEPLGAGILSSYLPDLRVAAISEIYPPPLDMNLAIGLLQEAIESARSQGAGTVKVVCQNDPLRSAAEALGGLHLLDKSVYAYFSKADRKRMPGVDDPRNWWCRAVNEAQLIEPDQFS